MRSVGAALVKLIATATSGLVSFTTNVIRPVKVTCEFSPVQEGTGDPSPDNVRPISGWTGCEIGHTGKNLFDGTVTNARIQNGVVIATGSYRLSEYIRVKPDTSYALVDKDGNLSQIFSHFFDENKTFLQSITTTEGIVVSPAGASYMRFHVTSRAFGDQKPFMLFEGSTAADYEPYQGATLPITFTDPSTGDPMTVYGGTVTLNEDGSADVVATHGFITYDGSESWQAGTLKKSVYGSYIRNTETASIWGDSPIVAWSNMAIQGNGAYTQSSANKICATGNWLYYSVDSSVAKNVDELKTFLSSNNLQLVYPLKTPATYHFDNIGQLQSFLGTNNIWHNMNGSITAEYYNKQ